MKQSITILLTFLFFSSVFGQQFISGHYDSGLKLSFDSATKKVTGYFEEYTGRDEQTGNPKFSCIFYIEGEVTGKNFIIKTYYPTEINDNPIQGTLEIVTTKEVKIKLPNEHGGCWNVQHFADKPVMFTLEASEKWIQIRYVDTAKTYFYSDKFEDKRLKSFLLKGDFVCIEKIENQWAYCTYYGEKITKGWLKLSDLNML